MNLLAITGSPRKKGNCRMIIQAVTDILHQQIPDAKVDILNLADLDIPFCRGCCACFNKGENACPDRSLVTEISNRMEVADAILLASPVYAHQVTALMKNFIDHLAFFFHRTQFAGKPALVIVTTDGSGLKETLNYLSFTATGWGCYLTGKIGVVSPFYLWSTSYQTKINKQINSAVQKLIGILTTGCRPSPSLYELLYFRAMRQKATFIPCDQPFWKQKGWFAQDYYLDIPINPLKACLANIYENLSKILTGSFTKKFLTQAEFETIQKRVQEGKGTEYDKQLISYIESHSAQEHKPI